MGHIFHMRRGIMFGFVTFMEISACSVCVMCLDVIVIEEDENLKLLG